LNAHCADYKTHNKKSDATDFIAKKKKKNEVITTEVEGEIATG
jgi:hypothetical protein